MAISIEAYDPNLPGILRLSPEIRRRIYLYAGLGPGKGYDDAPAVYDLCGQNGRTKTWNGYKLGFHGLLASCRTIHAEASALVYSTNWFILRYQQRQSLEPLRALTPVALASLTNLRVVLNQTSCHQQKIGYEGYGGCCEDGWADGGRIVTLGCKRESHQDEHDFPLDGSNSLAKAMLAEWDITVAHIAPHIIPRTLQLSLVCDVHHDDVESAKLVLAALGSLPPLKDCHVRLSGAQHSQLQKLAQRAVLRACGILPSDKSMSSSAASLRPRLVDLPRELRLRILEFTDLITPWKEVMWNRAERGYQRHNVPCFPLEGRGNCNPEFHHGCQFVQCSLPSYPQPSVGCFCRRRHAAYSLGCRCWSPPTPLFLVCRTLYQDANLVFYGENRFIVVDGLCDNPFLPWPPGDYPHASFAASQFLRDIVPRHCLGHLRFLELAFAPFPHQSWPQDGHPAVQGWAETVVWVKNQLTLPGLTLRLIMAGNLEWSPNGSDNGMDSGIKELTQAQGKEVLAGYRRILGPLKHLDAASNNGLARFYAEMAWPWKWGEWVKACRDRDYYTAQKRLKSREQELRSRTERFILGDRYHLVSSEVAQPPQSVWQWSCLRHC